MNCPQCEQNVGNDEYSFGPWQETFGPQGEPEGCERTLFVRCGCCGLFTARQHERGSISDIRQITNRGLLAAMTRKHIPAARVRPVAVGAC